ncbi:MAG: alkaline phosphatase family protein [Bacteroidota bacterium]
MIFCDGVGIGKADPAINPFFHAALPTLSSLLGSQLPHLCCRHIQTSQATLIPLNATLGVSGLPQSGTGQTTLLTGVNAARLIGKHFGPYPYSALRPILNEKNIFRQLIERRKRVCFANAYPRPFFEYVQSGKTRLTATVLSCLFSDVQLRGEEELRAEEAVSSDLTRTRWKELGHDRVEPIAPETAGEHLYELSQQSDFTLFDFYLTDHAGHSQSMQQAAEVLERFDGFLSGILRRYDETKMLLLLTSDHGNSEDLSAKSHTRNPVPLLLLGRYREDVASRLTNLTHLTPCLVDFLARS